MRRRAAAALGVANALTAVTALTVAVVGHGAPAAAGTPRYGGTLRLVGNGDVDYLDPNLTYYTVGYAAARIWSRQLVTYPAVAGARNTSVVADLAEKVPTRQNKLISADGLRVTIRIDPRAKWNSSPPRSVTADDAIRGVLRSCNPLQPNGALPDYEDEIVGLTKLCTDFSHVAQTAKAISAFLRARLHSVAGLRVGSDPQTIVFTLTRPTVYFVSQLALPVFNPAPVEDLAYLPGTADLARHAPSDGPYEIESYTPNASLVFRRNPVWDKRSDSVRKAYVDRIVIREDVQPYQVFNSIRHGAADMEWSGTLPHSQVPQMLARKDRNLGEVPTIATNPYLVFNTVSANNHGLLRNVWFRRAIECAINRGELIRNAIGVGAVAPPLTHVLPQGIVGSRQFDLYPYDVARAKRMLRRAHASSDVTLRLIYLVGVPSQRSMVTTLAGNLRAVGIRVRAVGLTAGAMFTQFLQWPRAARRGLWDMASVGWGPDWYGDAAFSFFEPLFGRDAVPPRGSDFGLYQSDGLERFIQQARDARDAARSATLWHLADVQVMRDAAIYPITSPNDAFYYDSSRLAGVALVPAFDMADPTNVWFTR